MVEDREHTAYSIRQTEGRIAHSGLVRRPRHSLGHCVLGRKRIVLFLLLTSYFLLLTFIFTPCGYAEEKSLEASLEENSTSVGNPVYLNISFYGDQNVSPPQVEPLDGLQVKYVGPSTRISVVNGRVSQSVTHNFLLIPSKEGQYELGPFKAMSGGELFVAPPVRLFVMGGGAPSQAGRQSVSSAPSAAPLSGPPLPDASPRRSYQSDRVFIAMDVGKRKVYVGETVPVTIRLYGTGVGLKDIEYPMYPHDGFSAGDFPEPQKDQEAYRGADYNVLVFRQDIFAIKEGDYTLGPATLKCTMLVRKDRPRRSSAFGRSIFDDDFFGSVLRGYQEYPIELSADAIHMTVLPLPADGRPADFQGAVGDFSFDVQTDSKKVKVGDPITLRMTISGRGNLDTVTAPQIRESDEFKAYEPQVSKKGNKKIYEQVIIPKTDKAKEIPQASFSFFNPGYGTYKTITRGPMPVEVTARPEGEGPVKMVTVPGTTGQVFYPQEKLGKDIIYIKEKPGTLLPPGRYLFGNPLFWIFQALPAGLLAVMYLSRRKTEKMRKDKRYARFLRAPRKARGGIARAKALIGKKDPVQFYDVVFKTIQEYIGDKFDLPKGAVTSLIIDESLRPAGYDDDALNMLKEVFDACEMARYASLIPDAEKEGEILEKMKRAIDHMEKTRV